MRLRILFISFVTVCASQSFSFNPVAAVTFATQGDPGQFVVEANGNGSSLPLTAPERLKKSIELAKAGDAERAIEMVRSSKGLDPNPLFAVEYVSTLLTIVEHVEEAQQSGIINEAIQSVNAMRADSQFDGRNNPETAYHFMVAVGRLAKVSLPLSEPTGLSLQVCEGTIARNLRNNPNFPANGTESLAQPLVSLATAYAAQQNAPLALQAITEAASVGFYDFEKLADDALLKRLPDQAALQAHLEKLQAEYLVKVQQWSRESVANFQRFRFEFNMDDVEGGSLSNRDFDGKILVVDFWATWCPPCREEIPHFIEMQENLENKDVQVLGVSMDAPDDPNSATETVKKFLADNNVNYPCGMGTPELKKRVPGDVKLPTTLFIDRSGTVRYMATGFHDYAKLAAIAEILAAEEQSVSAGMGQ